MKCPACEKELKEIIIDNCSVDICDEGCGGIWFDAKEIDKFNDGDEADIPVTKKSEPTIFKQRKCPRCSDEILVTQFADTNNKIQIDQCWGCGGIFLDYGELDSLKKEYKNNEERDAKLNEYIRNKFEECATKMSEETRARIEELDEKYRHNLITRSLIFISKMFGINVKVSKRLEEQIYSYDFSKK